MRTAIPLLMLLLSACATDGFRRDHDNLESALEKFETSLPDIEGRVREDDAKIGRALEVRELSPSELREVEEFTTERRRTLQRLRGSLEELRAIDQEMHRELDRDPDEARREAVRKRFAAWREEKQLIMNDLDRLQQRDRKIVAILSAAPKKEDR